MTHGSVAIEVFGLYLTVETCKRKGTMMKRLSVLLLMCTLQAGIVLASAQGQDFSIVVMPDTQFYTNVGTSGTSPQGGTALMFQKQTSWIAANYTDPKLKIAYVAHVGDITEHGDFYNPNAGSPINYLHDNTSCTSSTTYGNTAEWEIAKGAMATLETAGIPYGVAVGNHDQAPLNGGPNPPNTLTINTPFSSTTALCFNAYFGVSHFSGRTYYGGNYDYYHLGQNNSHYDKFTAGGRNYIVIYLEYDDDGDAGACTTTGMSPEPRQCGSWIGGYNLCQSSPCKYESNDPNLIPWAKGIVSANSSSTVFVVSHYIIDNQSPSNFGQQGQLIYDALKAYPNVQLMFAGHVPGFGRRQDLYGTSFSTISSLMADYQAEADGGNGYMRIYTISNANNTVSSIAYSPFLDPGATYPNGNWSASAAVKTDAYDAFQLQLKWTPRYDVFYRNTSDNKLGHIVSNAGTWVAPELIAATMTSEPAAVSRGANLLDVMYRGSNGNLTWRQWTGSAWTSEAAGDLGIAIAGAPALTARGTYRMDAFYRKASDNKIYRVSWNGQTQTWTDSSTPIGSEVAASDPSAVSWGPAQFDVVYRASDNSVHHMYSSDATTWNPTPEPLGGDILGKPSITSEGAGLLDVMVEGANDNSPWHNYYTVANGSWSGFAQEIGAMGSSPSSASWGPKRLDTVFRGTGTQLWDLWYDGNVANPTWTQVGIGGAPNGAPAVTSWSHMN